MLVICAQKCQCCFRSQRFTCNPTWSKIQTVSQTYSHAICWVFNQEMHGSTWYCVNPWLIIASYHPGECWFMPVVYTHIYVYNLHQSAILLQTLPILHDGNNFSHSKNALRFQWGDHPRCGGTLPGYIAIAQTVQPESLGGQRFRSMLPAGVQRLVSRDSDPPNKIQ